MVYEPAATYVVKITTYNLTTYNSIYNGWSPVDHRGTYVSSSILLSNYLPYSALSGLKSAFPGLISAVPWLKNPFPAQKYNLSGPQSAFWTMKSYVLGFKFALSDLLGLISVVPRLKLTFTALKWGLSGLKSTFSATKSAVLDLKISPVGPNQPSKAFWSLKSLPVF